jgi:hypothetical protein
MNDSDCRVCCRMWQEVFRMKLNVKSTFSDTISMLVRSEFIEEIEWKGLMTQHISFNGHFNQV